MQSPQRRKSSLAKQCFLGGAYWPLFHDPFSFLSPGNAAHFGLHVRIPICKPNHRSRCIPYFISTIGYLASHISRLLPSMFTPRPLFKATPPNTRIAFASNDFARSSTCHVTHRLFIYGILYTQFSVSIYIYIYIYVCICIYIYIYVCIYIYRLSCRKQFITKSIYNFHCISNEIIKIFD